MLSSNDSDETAKQSPPTPTWQLRLCSESESESEAPTTFSTLFLSNEERVKVYKTESIATLTLTQTTSNQNKSTNTNSDIVDSVCGNSVFLGLGHVAFLLNCFEREHSATLELESTATSSAFNCDASFVAIGDTAGFVHLIHVETSEVAVSLDLTRLIPHAPSKGSKITSITFIQRNSNTEEMVLVLESLVQIRFSNINFTLLEHAITNGDAKAGLDAKAAISMDVVDLRKESDGLVQSVTAVLPWSGDFSSSKKALLMAGSGNAPLTIWNRTNGTNTTILMDSISSSLAHNVIKAEIDSNGKYMVLLESSGFLSLWDFKRLILIKRYSTKEVSDFLIMSSTKYELSVLTLLTPSTESTYSRYIEVITLPSNTVTHRIQVSINARLIPRCRQSQKQSQDASSRIYFLEHDNTNDIATITIRAISETHPSEKINSLIRSGAFEEALKVAEQFGLDLEVNLNNIQDDTFTTTFSLSASLRTHSETHALLTHARARVSASEDLSILIHQTIHRLGTFQVLSVHDRVSRQDAEFLNAVHSGDGYVDVFDAAEWHLFRGADVVEVLVERWVGYIWRRHYGEELMNRVMDVLNAIPETCSVRDFGPWIERDVLPFVVETELYIMIAEWIHIRTRLIESTQSRPHDALALISLLFPKPKTSTSLSHNNNIPTSTPITPGHHVTTTLATASKSDTSTFGYTTYPGKPAITLLKQQLEDLVYLWDVHAFPEPGSIALDLLDRVSAVELIPSAVEESFRVYAGRHGIDGDVLLGEYCLEVMDKSVGLGKVLAGGPWESRVLVLREQVKNFDVKSGILLELMYRTPIPWSDAVEQEIVETLNDKSGSRYQDIIEQYRLMRLKRMLLAYGMEGFNISDLSKSKSLLMFILSKLDSLSAMKEAMQVVSIYPQLTKLDAYTTRLRNLFEAGHLDRGLLLLKTGYEMDTTVMPVESIQTPVDKLLDVELELDLENKLNVGEEIMCWLVEVMDCAVAEEEKYGTQSTPCKETFVWAVTAAVELAQLLQTIKSDFKDEFKNQTLPKSNIASAQKQLMASHISALEMTTSCCSSETIKSLGNLKDLSKEFDIRIKVSSYRNDEAARRVVLNRFAKEVFKYGERSHGKGTASPVSTDFSRTELYRLAELLGFERSSLDGIIAEEAARNGDVKTALLLCKELYEKSPDAVSAATLKNIALLLTSFAAENKDVFKNIKETKSNFRLTKWILELSQKSVSVCSEDLIGDCLDDFKNYEILHAIFTQCDAGDYGTLLAMGSETTEKKTTYLYSGAGSSSSSSFGGSGSSSSSSASPPNPSISAFPVKWSISTKLSDRSLDLDVANIGDDFGASLFSEHYHEGGLVLPTEKAMGYATDYVLDISSAISRQAEAEKQERLDASFVLSPPAKSKNKGIAVSCDPISAGQELSMYLKSNRVLIAALRMWHRTIELRMRMSGALKESEISGEIIEHDADGHVQLVKQLSENVFSSRFIDQNLAFGGLLTVPTSVAFDVFKVGMSTTGKDYDRLLKFAAVGIATGLAWGQRGFQVNCQDMARNARWWHQFNLLNINVETDMFKDTNSNEYQRKILPDLLRKTGLDVQTALEFAASYKIEDDFVLFEYVRQLLVDEADNREYKYRVAGVLDDIANKELLAKLLKQVIASSSPYDYEKIAFVFNQILRLSPDDPEARKGLQVLEVLSNYTRRNPPNVSEFEELKQSRIKSGDILKMYPSSATCLPYHLLMRTGWEVIQHEIHETTISRLIALSHPLTIPSDQFYTAVVEGFIRRLNDPSSSVPTFPDVKPFLAKIQSLEGAVKQAILLAQAFPPGPDRVSSFKQAHTVGLKLLSSAETSAADEVAELQKYCEELSYQFKTAETENQLKSLGLHEFIDLSGRPESLIDELYRVKSEQALMKPESFDLHSIVNEIGTRFEIDVVGIRNRLLQRGLLQNVQVSPEDKELYLPSMRVQVNNLLNTDGERSLQMQLLYIARSVPIQHGMQFFIMAAYNPTSKIQTLHRIRSLSLLFQLASPENFEEDGKSYEEIRSYMQILLYLIDFEELRIVQSVKEFNECDKESLARSLWLNHGGEPKVVQLICNLCLDYGILDLNLWENALSRLAKLGASRYLAGIIDPVTCIPELSKMKSLSGVWNRLLITCLEEVVEKEDEALYERIIVLLQKCPFLYDLEIDTLVTLIINVKISTERAEPRVLSVLKGLSVLPPGRQVFSSIKRMIDSEDSQTLVKILSIISKVSGDDIGAIEYVKVQILQVIHSRREYACMEESPEEGVKLLKYLISIGETKPLIDELRSRGRDKEADDIEAYVDNSAVAF
ncbi:hypothetical protein BCR33DRAFT_717267 [Rhizoclosmatium globosum]|uniref:Uncharacterized protein n=1 Tax=Rhizoclosmatium globosum TaxID=329046 RepID=A0A1Y2CAY0_9FUNG|nr:hypothetical protein BCR33DRAFT_717267 [Rhizoclosmatium globosum]|eukprot:ORY44198.1 hypothetical protein BCR33DRAFT_717267 [Rhizoclosmatium globosum]